MTAVMVRAADGPRGVPGVPGRLAARTAPPPTGPTPERRPVERRAGVVRVLLVDDHALLRAGMARLLDLADDVTVVGGAASGAQALRPTRSRTGRGRWR